MEIYHSQLKINHLSDTPSTKAAGGGIFSGVFIKDVGRYQVKVKKDFELSWYLFFQHLFSVGF
jgi:hypothetical protein